MTEALGRRLALAGHYLSMGSLDRADQELDALGAEGLEREAFWVVRATVAAVREDPDGAIRAAQAGLGRFPESVPLLVLLGTVHGGAGRFAEAEQALLGALALDPEDVSALCAYAEVVAVAGQLDKARRLADRAASIDPDSSRVLRCRYRVANAAGDDRETARLAEALAGRADGNASALELLAAEAGKRGMVGRSRQLLERAASADVRVVERVGVGAFRELRAATHPLLWPMWPINRFGPGPVWAVWVVLFLGVRVVAGQDVAVFLAVPWFLYVVYTWVVPPLVARWARR